MEADVEDTYAEAFDGIYCRVIVTADDDEILRGAAKDATATPSIVIGRVEGGVEKWLNSKETPDARKGAILQFWGAMDDKKPLGKFLEKFETELSYRIRQDILVKPFTALFDASLNRLGKIDMMEKVGHCGDGFEWEEMRAGRRLIIVPLMVPDFVIERHLGYAKGVMGANFWYMCETKEAVMAAGKEALKAISEVKGVITPFSICAAGSKPETKFPLIGPTTNHPYCPSLEERLGSQSKIPQHIHFIPEIVINGVSLDVVKAAMKAGVEAARTVKDVRMISAGNYGGKLGRHKIRLKDIL
jgi:formylmethanofuran--tetrahydromethanopterin N-formyltransferase